MKPPHTFPLCFSSSCGPWNAHLNDKLENLLRKEMRTEHITLTKACEMISHDWRVTYKQYYGNP